MVQRLSALEAHTVVQDGRLNTLEKICIEDNANTVDAILANSEADSDHESQATTLRFGVVREDDDDDSQATIPWQPEDLAIPPTESGNDDLQVQIDAMQDDVIYNQNMVDKHKGEIQEAKETVSKLETAVKRLVATNNCIVEEVDSHGRKQVCMKSKQKFLMRQSKDNSRKIAKLQDERRRDKASMQQMADELQHMKLRETTTQTVLKDVLQEIKDMKSLSNASSSASSSSGSSGSNRDSAINIMMLAKMLKVEELHSLMDDIKAEWTRFKSGSIEEFRDWMQGEADAAQETFENATRTAMQMAEEAKLTGGLCMSKLIQMQINEDNDFWVPDPRHGASPMSEIIDRRIQSQKRLLTDLGVIQQWMIDRF